MDLQAFNHFPHCGIEPTIAWALAGCHCVATNSAAEMNFFIGFFLFFDRAASFHFGAVPQGKSHTQMPSGGV
jgi:hypothetical protein